MIAANNELNIWEFPDCSWAANPTRAPLRFQALHYAVIILPGEYAMIDADGPRLNPPTTLWPPSKGARLMVTPRMSTWAVADSDAVSCEAPKPKPEPQRSRKDLDAALALCVEALEAVEYLYDFLSARCGWCGYGDRQPHADDCLRERALAAAKGKNENQNG